MTSSRDIPMPLSSIVIVPASLSALIRTLKSGESSNKDESERPSKRSLSTASEALEINSLKKISLLL